MAGQENLDRTYSLRQWLPTKDLAINSVKFAQRDYTSGFRKRWKLVRAGEQSSSCPVILMGGCYFLLGSEYHAPPPSSSPKSILVMTYRQPKFWNILSIQHNTPKRINPGPVRKHNCASFKALKLRLLGVAKVQKVLQGAMVRWITPTTDRLQLL